MKQPTITTVAVAALCASFAIHGPLALADNTDVRVFHDGAPSADELVDALQVQPGLPKFQTRGLKRREATAPSASLKVNFAFGSSDLTGEAKQVLGNLADALKNPALANGRFLIEGHTDAVGSDAYNKALSDERARAVKQHLVAVHGVEAGRLKTVGRGESAPLDSANPDSGQNRRVQVVNVSDQ